MIVKNGCAHAKGQTCSQLWGPDRDEAINDFINAGEKPAEHAKGSIHDASNSTLHSQSLAVAVTTTSAQSLAQEANERKLAASGLTKCKLSNIQIAQSVTDKTDVDARDRIEDATRGALGVARAVEVAPDF